MSPWLFNQAVLRGPNGRLHGRHCRAAIGHGLRHRRRGCRFGRAWPGALGGSRVQIGGPTGAFIIIVYGILTKYGASNLAICTIMAGFMLLVMGAAKMGTMIKFIPYPVTMGFTSGIAVLIFCTQIKDFLGLQVGKVPAEFVEKIRVLGEHVPTGFLDQLGRENVCAHLDAALKRAREILNLPAGFSTSRGTRRGKAEPGSRAPGKN